VRPDQLARCGSRDQTQLGSLVGHVHPRGRVSLGAVRGPWGDPGRLLRDGLEAASSHLVLHELVISAGAHVPKRAVWLMTLPYSQALDGNRQCVLLAQRNHSNRMIIYA
jgi:hypothetical protein